MSRVAAAIIALLVIPGLLVAVGVWLSDATAEILRLGALVQDFDATAAVGPIWVAYVLAVIVYAIGVTALVREERL